MKNPSDFEKEAMYRAANAAKKKKRIRGVGVLKSGLLCGAPKCTGTVCVCKGTELFAYVGVCLRRVLCDNEWNKGPKVTSRPITFSFKDIFYCLEGA